MAVDAGQVRRLFENRFGIQPDAIVQAPGRVNLLGEHTDYNDGFVLPIAIDRNTVVAASKRQDNRLRMYAAQFDREVTVSLDALTRNEAAPWADYVTGVAWALQASGRQISGADLVVAGDVPLGCGLSSSASLEMAVLSAFEALGGFALPTAEAAQLGQRVENAFLGLSSGIMDQFICRGGRAGHALFLDCRSLAFELIPIAFDDAVFVIANTQVQRGLTNSKYNERVAECAEAVRQLCQGASEARKLRDFTHSDLEQVRTQMQETVYRRARHVLSENDRTLAGRAALQAGDAAAFGALMDASDASLRDDYEVTCPELDAMTAISRGLPGCYGARMTGAGFGGCTVQLVRRTEAERFRAALLADYKLSTGRTGEAYVTFASAGAGPVR